MQRGLTGFCRKLSQASLLFPTGEKVVRIFKRNTRGPGGLLQSPVLIGIVSIRRRIVGASLLRESRQRKRRAIALSSPSFSFSLSLSLSFFFDSREFRFLAAGTSSWHTARRFWRRYHRSSRSPIVVS